MYLQESFIDKALDDINQIIAIDPFSTTAYQKRAQIYLSTKDYSLAIEDLVKAKELCPRDGSLLFNLGIAYF